MKTPTISLMVLRASNVENSLQFYRALGLVFIEEQHGSGALHHSCDLGNSILEIYAATTSGTFDSRSAGATMIGFTVDSLDDILASLRELGVILKTSPKISDWGRWVNVSDPDGRVVQLTEQI